MLVAAGVLQSKCFHFHIFFQMQNWRSQITMLVNEEGGGSGGQIMEYEALFLGSFPSIPLQFGD